MGEDMKKIFLILLLVVLQLGVFGQVATVPSGSIINTTDSSMIVIKNDIYLYIRTKYDESRDLLQRIDVFDVDEFGKNAPVNWLHTYLIQNTNVNTFEGLFLGAVLIHNMGDNATPYCYDPLTMNYNKYSYFDGNHGYNGVVGVTVDSHDKTIEDVGSSWIDGDAETWYLIRVEDATSLLFLSKDSNSLTGSLTHTSGATHTASIIAPSVAFASLEPSVNNRVKIALLNNEIEITEDGVYYCENLTINDCHYIRCNGQKWVLKSM